MGKTLRRNGRYSTRRRIPKDLIAAYGRKEVVIALDTADPAEARQERRKSPTFGDLVDLYIARHLPTKKSRITDEGLLKHHLGHWRPRTLTSIARANIIALHTQIGTQPSTVIRPGRPTARPA